MSVSLRFSVISRLAGAAAVISMSGAGSAWAGDGGESLTGLNNVVSELCSFLGYNPTSCPQFPTITQAVLEVAGLETSPPEMVRALNDVAPGSTVDADNAAAVNPINSSGTTVPLPFPLTSTTSPTLSNLLSTLTPMAFTSATQQNLLQPGAQMNNTTANNTTAAATHLYDPEAKTFFYAVASGPPPAASSGLTVPNAINFFYDQPSWPFLNFLQGQMGAKFLLPLMVLNNDGVTERPVPAILHYIPPKPGGLPCSASKIVGNFSGAPSGTQTLMATQIGVNCAVVSSASPILPIPHWIFEVHVSALVTFATDPPYFNTSGAINMGIPGAFSSDVDGFAPAPGILGASGEYIGIAPSAVPLCTSTSCPAPTIPPTTPPPGVFSLCADLPQNFGQGLVHSVAAYYALSTAGETLLSAALPGVFPAASASMCPPL